MPRRVLTWRRLSPVRSLYLREHGRRVIEGAHEWPERVIEPGGCVELVF